MPDNLKAKGISSFIWDFSGKVINTAIGLIVFIFLARLLEPFEFGLVAIVMVIIGLASIFSDSGLGVALIQRRRVLPIHYSSVFYFNIIVSIILALITFFSADFVAGFYNDFKLVSLVQVMSLSFLISAFSSVQNILLRKELHYVLLTKIGLSSSLVGGIVGIVLALNGGGVWSLVAQNLTGGLVSNILLWRISKWKPSLEFSLKALIQLWSFGFHVFLTTLIENIFKRLDVLIVGKLFSTEILGFFDRAKSLNQMIINYTSGSLMSILFPVLAKVQKDLPRFQKIAIKAFGIISFITFLFTGIFYLVSKELIVLLFSEKWLSSVNYFQILVLSGFVYAYSALLLNILISRGNSKLFLRIDIYKKVLFALNLYFGFLFGIEGYLYGFLFVSLLGHIINVYYALQEIKISSYFFIKPTVVQLVIAIISFVITNILTQEIVYSNFIALVEKSVIFSTLYITISWILKTDSYLYTVEQIRYIVDKAKR